VTVPVSAITIVVDNRSSSPLGNEHGFALWVEAGGLKILMDTGPGATLENNASLLGIDLRGTEMLVLSHGHYDHTGAVDRVLELAPEAELFLHPEALLPRYSRRGNQSRAIRMPRRAMSAIIDHPEAKVHWSVHPVELAPGIWLTGSVPRLSGFEDPGGPFLLDPEGVRPDPIADDQSLWISDEEGLVICTGCCHSGIVNTVNRIMRICGCSRIKKIIGGFHLVEAGTERLEKTVAELNRIQVDEVVPCHCTGSEAEAFLAANLNCRVTPGYAGMRAWEKRASTVTAGTAG